VRRERSSQAIRPNFGGRSSEQEALPAVVGRVVAAVDPQAIWLFGSRARGDARPDSDFDLLVVARPGGDLASDDFERVDRAINGLGIGCDLVPSSVEDFESGAELRTSFVARVLAEGRSVYEAP
jgi:predicted nucleotidyltransferase